MAPTTQGRYEYRPESLINLRKQIGLKQTEMAAALGVPANTLSRWETGTTTPDAQSLASLFSIAMERGVTPEFFQRRRPAPKPSQGRARLLVIWDFQNMAAPVAQVPGLASWLREELDRRFASASHRLYKAFAYQRQSAATDELLNMGWRVWEDDQDLHEEIVSQALSDSGQEPEDTTLVLIAEDARYGDLIEDTRGWGVRVYLITPSGHFANSLVDAVGDKRWVQVPSECWSRTPSFGVLPFRAQTLVAEPVVVRRNNESPLGVADKTGKAKGQVGTRAF